ncbi:MAG: hypothetical protein M3P84_12730 [Chloroflexota bacterium]|nr:hypothetical protein [Chloroflexota bacterium]
MTPASRSSPGSLRAGLRRLATGLIAYGIAGVVLAVLAGIALGWAGGRLGSVGGRVETQVAGIVATLDRTSAALRDAGSSATSFSGTMERTPPVVRQTAQTIADLRTDLLAVEQQLAQVQILGSRPLGTVADGFGRMAANLEGLDVQLEVIAADLDSNRTALVTNAASLTLLGESIGLMADDLEGGVVEDGLADLRASIMVLAVVLIVWIAIPAIGALWLGWWLRSEVGEESD